MLKKNILLILLCVFCLYGCGLRDKDVVYKEPKDISESNIFTTDYKSDAYKKLKVGFLLPLSGDAMSVGLSLFNTATLALFEHNKKNILLRVYDTEGTDFGAVSAINKAIEDGVNVVVGPLFYAETRAIAGIAKNNNILVFSLSNEERLRGTDNVFVTGAIAEQEIEQLLTKLVEENNLNYLAFLPNDVYGATIHNILKRKIKAKDATLIKADFYLKNDETSFEKKLANLLRAYRTSDEFNQKYEESKNESTDGKQPAYIVNEPDKIYPDVLFIAEGDKISEAVGKIVYKHLKNTRNIKIVGITKLDTTTNIEKNPYLNGAIFTGGNPELRAKFQNSYQSAYNLKPARPINISTLLYDLIRVLDKFYTFKNNHYVLDTTQLFNPLGFDGIEGKFRFLPNGLIERNFFVMQVLDGEKQIIEESRDFLNY